MPGYVKFAGYTIIMCFSNIKREALNLYAIIKAEMQLRSRYKPGEIK